MSGGTHPAAAQAGSAQALTDVIGDIITDRTQVAPTMDATLSQQERAIYASMRAPQAGGGYRRG